MKNNLTKTDQEQLQKRLKIEWTYNSNAIEGNTISLSDTAFIVEYGLTLKGKSIVEHTDIIGHAKAIDIIYELIEKNSITEENLFLLHKAVQTEIIIDYELPIGAYKVIQNARYVRVDGKLEHKYYPHPNHIKHLMDLWFKKFGDISTPLESFEACVERYIQMHLAFASIHPFFDGNGRLARLVANIPLLKNGYLPLIVSSEDRQEYIELLSEYNLKAKSLDETTTKLIEENKEYKKLYQFFYDQYKNSQELLDEIIRSKR